MEKVRVGGKKGDKEDTYLLKSFSSGHPSCSTLSSTFFSSSSSSSSPVSTPFFLSLSLPLPLRASYITGAMSEGNNKT